jgi:ankyrin repeat protein
LARSVQLAINYPLNHTYDICAFLIANGADKTIKDASGKTAYDYAVEAQDETLISLLSD